MCDGTSAFRFPVLLHDACVTSSLFSSSGWSQLSNVFPFFSTVPLSFFSFSVFTLKPSIVHVWFPTAALVVGLMAMIITVTDFPIISGTKQLQKCTYCCDLISTQEQEMSVCVCVWLYCVWVCAWGRERDKLVSGEIMYGALHCTFPWLRSRFLCP